MYDKRTASACKDVVADKLRKINAERNKFEKTRGKKIFPNPFADATQYAHTAEEWFDIFYQCSNHLKEVQDGIQKIEAKGGEVPKQVKDGEVLDQFILVNFPDEVKASEGRSSSLIAISIIERLANSLSARKGSSK